MIRKINTKQPFELLLIDATGAGVTGIAAPTVYVRKNGGALTLATETTDYTWAEVSSVNAPGHYTLTPVTTLFTDTLGACMIRVSHASAEPEAFAYLIRTYTEDDLKPVGFDAGGTTTAPTIASISSSRNNRLRLTYSKPVEMTTAANGALHLANYSITGPSTVSIVSLSQVDDSTVDIVTSGMTAGASGYQLVVLNVEDLDGNSI